MAQQIRPLVRFATVSLGRGMGNAGLTNEEGASQLPSASASKANAVTSATSETTKPLKSLRFQGLACIAIWRGERDSNPRYDFSYTHFPGVLLQPLGHLTGSRRG